MITLLFLLLFLSLLLAFYAWTLVYLLKDHYRQSLQRNDELREAQRDYYLQLLAARAASNKQLEKERDDLKTQLEDILESLIKNH